MNVEPMTCHERLSNFLSMPKPNDPRIEPCFINQVKKYLLDHLDQFNKQDLPNLKLLRDKNLALEKICDVAISTINKKAKTSLEESRDVFNIMSTYLQVDDLINLCLVGKAPESKTITEIIDSSSSEDIQNFASHVFDKFESDPDTSTAMIRIFFLHASSKAQSKFFAFNCERKISDFFNHVIDSLPINLTHLNLRHRGILLCDEDVKRIINRLNCLEFLDLNNGDKLTDLSLNYIANNSNMIHLKSLKFSGSSITDEGIAHLARSVNMAALERLRLKNCKHLTDRGVLHLANSPYIKELRVLNFADSNNFTCNALDCLVRSPNMCQLEHLSFYRCYKITNLIRFLWKKSEWECLTLKKNLINRRCCNGQAIWRSNSDSSLPL